jgi:type VII secretion-associated serine protease mycosin
MLRRRGPRAVALAAAGIATILGVTLSASPARADPIGAQAYASEGWVLTNLNLWTAWRTTKGSGVTVAVIDSGVNPSVPDLRDQVATGPDYSGVNTPSSNPDWGVHGTWMASLVAGHEHGSEDGILGSAPAAKVLSIRVITDSQDPNYAKYQQESAATGQTELANAISYAVGHGAGVISLSLGYSLQSRQVRAALQDAYDHNVVVVASAGNSGDAAGATGTGSAPYSYPADYPGVLSVAAVTISGQVASFSSENLSVLVAAPGKSVPAEGNDGGYWYVSGTSPACALTAGVAALIKSAYPRLTDRQVISAITSNTTPTSRPPGGWDQQIGFGEVNAGLALTAAGRIAAAGPPSAGLAAASHFGGGPAAVPPVPVAPRGPGALIGFALLGLACLSLIAFATSRLLTPAGSRRPNRPGAGGPAPKAAPGLSEEAGRLATPANARLPWLAGSPPPQPRHAAPRGQDNRPVHRDRPPL